MVGDDNCETQLLGQVYFRYVGNTAVHGNQELRLSGNLPDGIGIQAVAFRVAGGDAVSQGSTFLVQHFHKNGGGTDTIGIIVPVDKDRLS